MNGSEELSLSFSRTTQIELIEAGTDSLLVYSCPKHFSFHYQSSSTDKCGLSLLR